MIRVARSLCLLLPAALFSGWLVSADSEEISISPSGDTFLLEFDPGFNMGGQRDLVAGTLGSMAGDGRSRALYKFDVEGALPGGAEITAARLRIDVVRTPEGKRNSTFGLYRVLADWGEGTKRGDNPGGAPADDGEATWLARFHPDALWSEPGGAFGVDFAAEVSAERAVVGDGTYVFEMNESGVADLRDWLENPDRNFGWALATQEEERPKTARRWASREHRTDPPVLEIEIAAGSTEVPLPMLIISVSPGVVSIEFVAEPGIVYRLERSDDLAEWRAVQEVMVTEQKTVEIVDATERKSVYYRVSASD